MRLYDHRAELDFRDGGEVWLHFQREFDDEQDVTVELMRETLEDILKEMDRIRTREDLMMKLDGFTTTCTSIIEDFIIFATES